MSAAVKIGHLSDSFVWLSVFSSVPPSGEVTGPEGGLTLSLTIFGNDPDEPLEGKQILGTGLVGAVKGWLVESGPRLGLAADGAGGKVEWEIDHQRLGTHKHSIELTYG